MDEAPKSEVVEDIAQYKGLHNFLHTVRWTQHLIAIIAEILILVSFAMSGMDVSLGGVMASVPLLKVLWAAMFALGIDTAFALSWVRVRQCVNHRRWGSFVWNILLALSMSFIIFQPIAIQLLQQTLNISFEQAVANLGINIVLLTYARSAVAILLGAILAMTNVERTMYTPTESAGTLSESATIEQVAAPEQLPEIMESSEPEPTAFAQSAELPAQFDEPTYDTPEQRMEKISEFNFTGLIVRERIAIVLNLFPDLSDRELGKLSGTAAATAKKHREALKHV